MALDTQRDNFEGRDYTVDNAYARHEDKQEMYETFDNFKKASDEYWEMKDEKELGLQIGTDEDHRARFNDLMKTPEGKQEMEHTVCSALRVACTVCSVCLQPRALDGFTLPPQS